MILTQLVGGLGNQMFQYACGRALANRLNTELKLDLSWFEKQDLRHYELNAFNIVENIATTSDIDLFQTGAQKPAGIRTFLRWLKSDYLHFPEQQAFAYNPAIEHLAARQNIYLTGYWQSEKYFEDQTAIIRSEFIPRQPLSAENNLLSTEMENCQSISVHIRRGDYVNVPQTAKVHLVCTLPYYQAAMLHINQTVSDPYFYVFSDDPEWCAQNLRSEHPIKIISNQQTPAHHELYLYSHCHHHILSNSSFSWWGCWLNNKVGPKQIIVPDHWSQKHKTTETNIIPKHWNATVLSTTD